jgi:hypothetical protein
MEMHGSSQNFMMEMCSRMDSFYQELITTSEASEEEACDVIGACIKMMFETIRVPRAQASKCHNGHRLEELVCNIFMGPTTITQDNERLHRHKVSKTWSHHTSDCFTHL